MELKSKYSIGDVVFRADRTAVSKQHPCPDCNGTRKWKAQSPAGGEYEFDCPRCSASYNSDSSLSLKYSEFVGTVQRLTIGSVRIDTADPDGIYYMCIETGVGSGTLHREHQLHPTAEEAQVHADALALEVNQNPELWVKKQYDKSLKLSDYQLTDCKNKIKEMNNYDYQYKVEDFVNALTDAENMAEVKELVEAFIQ